MGLFETGKPKTGIKSMKNNKNIIVAAIYPNMG
jgi:hypothetical protein